ncbi:PREDICTED: uncharacterized protein LOC108691715, partial [Atta colombica]|uniref:uncharacterized protein LOC108691715 n=1 Tax=Atta colombica TaxID=520822 RepID=UPI00084C823D
FAYVGGFTLKEAINLCFKENFVDSRPLYNTRIIQAIYKSICKNRHFNKPSRFEFQNGMKEALRMAKKRYSSRTRSRAKINRKLWNDRKDESEDNRENEIKNENSK